MKLYSKKQSYIDNSSQSDYSYHQEFDNGLVLKAELIFFYDEYAQYQQTLVKEMLEELETEANSAKFSIIKFKSYFELALQELNSKLAVFAEKLRLFEKIEIRGFVEFFMDNYYVCSVIGDGSLTIFRKGALYYSLHNDATNNKKIDLFAELIEGDLHSGDDILFFANNISYFTDAEDFHYVGELNGTDDRTLLQIIEDMLGERTDMRNIGIINVDSVKFDQQLISNPKTQTASDYIDHIGYWFKKRRYILSVSAFGLLICLLVGLLVANFLETSNGVKLAAVDDQTQEYFSLAGLKKEIEQFKALDPTVPEKYNMYKNLENKINALEAEGKLPLDIKQLKNMLQAEYQAWFNIESIDQLDEWIVTFNSTDLLDLGTPMSVFAGQQINVGGSAGAMIGISSSEVRWVTQKVGLETRLLGCSLNLQVNGLLCFDGSNTIYNLTKQNIQTATVSSGLFEQNIKQLSIFGSNLYTLVDNPVLNSNGTFIMRYPLVPGTKENFKPAIPYTFASWANPASISNMNIDGSFLLWSNKDQTLYQLRRDGTESKSRKVTMQWGRELHGSAGSGMKIISYANSSYVYLFEPGKNILIVYKSTPSKASDASKYSYSLKYFFALQLPPRQVIDIAVSDSSKPQLYLLTEQGVANVKLYDYIESYDSIEQSNAQAQQQ